MDKKEGSSTNFMPDDLLEIICIFERGEKHNPYKSIRKRNYFSLITKAIPKGKIFGSARIRTQNSCVTVDHSNHVAKELTQQRGC